ncbi:hypothetical protein M0Q28_05520 [Patescibacteria group bacterium]|nr:hypothetical protein [Patescibacteria group bacterium]
MTTRRCPACKRFEPLRPRMTGVTRGKHDEILAATYLCDCGEPREISIGRTTIQQMNDARLAEIDNMRARAAV